jgi:glucokinase
VTQPQPPLAIGVDIGGTKIAGGVVDAQGRVVVRTYGDTPADDTSRTRRVVIDMIRELTASHPVVAVGVGAAGWVDEAGATVRYSPNLAWRDEPLRDVVAAAVPVPVLVANDGNAAAWAEYRFGAGRRAAYPGSDDFMAPGSVAFDSLALDPMVLVTVGTGVGGGVVIGGQLVRGAHGMAGELGHIRAVPDGLACGCGRRGCLEQYASGRALVRLARTGAAHAPQDAGGLLALAGGEPEAITGPLVTTAARAGDKVAGAAFDEVGRWLGAGLADLVQILDPSLVVIGGGVADAGELLLAPTRQAYAAALAERGTFPVAPVQVAQLGGDAGMIGAADLARRG